MIAGEKHYEESQQDEDVPSDHDDCKPTGKDFDDSEGNKCRDEEELVSDWIEIGPQFSPLVSHACNQTIDSIRNACNCKSDNGPSEEFIHDENDEDRNQKDPCQGHHIGQIHR